MERLLYFLPAHSQPAYIRFGMSALIMAFFILVQMGLQSQSGFGGLFFLLPGIFLCGILFDRGSSFLGRRSPRYMRCTPRLLHRGLRIFYLLDFSLRRASLSAELPRDFVTRWRRWLAPRKRKRFFSWS
jgi:hypothetical protein